MSGARQVVAMALLAGGVVMACGGQPTERDANDGASNGGKGGANGGGSAGDSGTTGGAGAPDFCFLEPDAGSCRGAMRRYAYHQGPGICLPFTYGGCEGNSNNFESVVDCMGTCIGDHPERTDCDTPFDCSLMPTTCCGECTYPELSNTVAVANAEINDVYVGMGCSAVGCVPCEPAGPNPWLVASCESGRCVAIDARETGLTECGEDVECVLRGGLGCCEDCQTIPSRFVAVNRSSNLREVLCGNSAVGCDPCVPTPPQGMSARCVGGRCVVDPGTVAP